MGDAPDAAALSDDPDAAADLAELLAGQKRKRAPRNQSKKAMKSAAGSARTVAAGSWQPPLTVLEVQLLTTASDIQLSSTLTLGIRIRTWLPHGEAAQEDD